MHEFAELFLSLDDAKKRATCIQLCEMALQVWESNFSDGSHVTYQESVAGSTQVLDRGLPREALAAVRLGTDTANISQRYLEPLAALRDDDVVFPEAAQFAYYAIHTAFERYVRERKIDEWTIANQVLVSVETPDPRAVLSGVLCEIV